MRKLAKFPSLETANSLRQHQAEEINSLPLFFFNNVGRAIDSHYSATLLVSPKAGEGIDARAFAARSVARLRTIRIIRQHSYSLQTNYIMSRVNKVP